MPGASPTDARDDLTPGVRTELVRKSHYIHKNSGLPWHGMIPEGVVEIQSATLKRPAAIENAFGRFSYVGIPAAVYPVGIMSVRDGEIPFLIASPTKALCDTIARQAGFRSMVDVRHWLESHLQGIATELASWGFTIDAESKSEGERSGSESAFLMGNTQMNLLQIGAPADLAARMPRSREIQIKLEMDLNPPPFASTEVRTQLLPTPYQVRLYDPESLFAGKLHAVLCRAWKSRGGGLHPPSPK